MKNNKAFAKYWITTEVIEFDVKMVGYNKLKATKIKNITIEIV
jgi:hypothetical protein